MNGVCKSQSVMRVMVHHTYISLGAGDDQQTMPSKKVTGDKTIGKTNKSAKIHDQMNQTHRVV